jgi:hypothetical protein
MSLEAMLPIGAFVLVYVLFKFREGLADGEHEMLKLGLSGFGLVMGYQLVLLMAEAVQDAGTMPGVDNMLGRLVWVYGTGMILVFMYFLYNILIRFLDWRQWKKKRDPFANTDKRYFE